MYFYVLLNDSGFGMFEDWIWCSVISYLYWIEYDVLLVLFVVYKGLGLIDFYFGKKGCY